MRNFFHRRLLLPMLTLLQQGVSPEKLALSIALGAVVAVNPALGWSTILCLLLALALRLNLPAIQLTNYFCYPLQIALLLPFFRLGEKLFSAPHLPISVAQIYSMAHAGLWPAIKFLWSTTWHALIVWALAAPLLTLLIYILLLPVFRRALRQSELPPPIRLEAF